MLPYGLQLVNVPLALPTMRPRWFILYNGLEPSQHRQWHCRSDVGRGVVKWLHVAGGYGRLTHQRWYWQPVPADRGVGVDVEKPPAPAKAG